VLRREETRPALQVSSPDPQELAINLDRTRSTLWQIAAPSGLGRSGKAEDAPTGDSTQKPLECIGRPIRNHTGQRILDPFCGSGSTIVAAHQLDRVVLGIEIDPGDVAVTLDRLTKLGLKPELIR
jgi:DNA modification methylase